MIGPIFAVLRVRKLKSISSINNADSHNRRDLKVTHAKNNGKCRRLLGGDCSLYAQIEERLEETSAKRRVDSVLAMEIVMSASPAYFRPDNISAMGSFDKDRMLSWARASLDYAKEKWRENLVAVDLHLDESTPHLHLVVTPIAKKKRKVRGKEQYVLASVLDANSMFGKKSLIQMQDEYAEQLSPLGIRRGLKGKKANHQSVKEFYKLVNLDQSTTRNNPVLHMPPMRNRKRWLKENELKVQKELAKKDRVIEFQRRKLNSLEQSFSIINMMGGVVKITSWFKEALEQKRSLNKSRKEIRELKSELNHYQLSFNGMVDVVAEKKVEQYKAAYWKKSNELNRIKNYQEEGMGLNIK